MALIDDDDMEEMFDSVDGPAVASIYDGSIPLDVIFDAAYIEQLGIAGTRPMALGKAGDFPAVGAVGKTLLIGTIRYTIKGREPIDDGALVLLTLKTSNSGFDAGYDSGFGG